MLSTFLFKMEVDPVGEVQDNSKLNAFIITLKNKWTEYKQALVNRVNLIDVTKFLIMCLDGLIVLVDGLIENGPDKKATVLISVANLFDYVSKEAIPLWLKPFYSGIKQFIVYTVVSILIDWVVAKYNSGDWRKE